MSETRSSDVEQVRTAEVVAALSLATDLGMGFPLEHGLHGTLVASRLAQRLGVDVGTASDTYYGALLFYIGCTADAEVSATLFDEGVMLEYFIPVVFGTPAQTLAGIIKALADQDRRPAVRAVQGVSRLPRAVRGHRQHTRAMCQVAELLSAQLPVPRSVPDLFVHLTERWDGRGGPARLRGEAIPLAMRIIQVARDATFHCMIGGPNHAAGVVRARAGHAFDPEVATVMADEADEMLVLEDGVSAWDDTLAAEPEPRPMMAGDEIDRALAAMGDFADLVSPFLVGHSAGVATLATAAAQRCGLPTTEVVAVQRAARVHDIGRVALPAGIWAKSTSLSPDEWERVRLHAYHSERVLARSPFLAALVPVATCHHERLDGTGYHRGAAASALTTAARLLAASDAYHAMTEPRAHRGALSPGHAAAVLGEEAGRGRLDASSVAAVLEAAGHPAPPPAAPNGLTPRETEVVGLLARGLLTKQIGHALGISAKTADRHVQNAYAKMGVSTRAAAAVFAMQHGLADWGELPIGGTGSRS